MFNYKRNRSGSESGKFKDSMKEMLEHRHIDGIVSSFHDFSDETAFGDDDLWVLRYFHIKTLQQTLK